MDRNEVIDIKGKKFFPYIKREWIKKRVTDMAQEVWNDVKSDNPLFLIMLNGAYAFAADFLSSIPESVTVETLFLKYSSYIGTESSGEVVRSGSLPIEKIKGRTVVVIEDIVDTGLTMKSLESDLTQNGVKRILIASFLSKPSRRKVDIKIDYIGKEVEDLFVLGYGLDFDGLGRNLQDIYCEVK